MIEDVVSAIGPYGGALIIGFVGGIVPIVWAELFIGAMALSLGAVGPALAVAMLAAVGQMAATAIRYWAGRGAANIPKGRLEKPFQKAQAKVEQWKDKPLAIIFLSSLVGFPPFYFIAILAGTFRLSFRAIMIVGGVARCLRFGAVALAPLLF
ncbi:MAG: VTT domain-containing protein [Kofleriaceae bacterium]